MPCVRLLRLAMAGVPRQWTSKLGKALPSVVGSSRLLVQAALVGGDRTA